MIRDTRSTTQPAQPRDPKAQGRFQLEKLEQRIAPKCSVKPNGHVVGNCEK